MPTVHEVEGRIMFAPSLLPPPLLSFSVFVSLSDTTSLNGRFLCRPERHGGVRGGEGRKRRGCVYPNPPARIEFDTKISNGVLCITPRHAIVEFELVGCVVACDKAAGGVPSLSTICTRVWVEMRGVGSHMSCMAMLTQDVLIKKSLSGHLHCILAA